MVYLEYPIITVIVTLYAFWSHLSSKQTIGDSIKLTLGFSTSTSTSKVLKSLSNMDEAGKSLLIWTKKIKR